MYRRNALVDLAIGPEVSILKTESSKLLRDKEKGASEELILPRLLGLILLARKLVELSERYDLVWLFGQDLATVAENLRLTLEGYA